MSEMASPIWSMSARRVALYAYFGLVFAAAALVPITVVVGGYGVGKPWVVICLSIVAALSERGRIRLGNNIECSISLLPMIFAAMLLGPVAGAVVGAASLAGDCRRPYMRWAVYTATRSVTGGVTGLPAVGAAALGSGELGRLVVATTIAALVAETLDLGLAAITYSLRGTGRAWDVIGPMAPLVLAFVPLYTPVVVLLAIAYRDISPLVLPLFFAPALAAQRMFVLYQDQRRLARDLGVVNDRLERANMSFTSALVATLDARDRYTAGHSAAVAVYAKDIAERMALSPAEQQLVYQCGLVHDIGKIGLAPGLLEKPGALTLDERRQMEKHSEIGARILAEVEDYAEIARIVRHHHERVDGQGYPDAVSGEDIPLLSRIIAVADAYNAMTSDRPYRDAMPSRVARLRLAQAVETQFDTAVVAAFEAILAGATEDYRCAKTPEFAFTREKVAERGSAFVSTLRAA